MPAIGVNIRDLRTIRRWLRQFHPELLPILRDELKAAVDSRVTPRVRSKMPNRSGAAAGSVRARGGGNTTYLVAGSSRVPYFGWLDFGGTLAPTGRRRNTQRRPVVRSGRFMYPAVAESTDDLNKAAGRAVDAVIRRV
jgi:hypothetical protein